MVQDSTAVTDARVGVKRAVPRFVRDVQRVHPAIPVPAIAVVADETPGTNSLTVQAELSPASIAPEVPVGGAPIWQAGSLEMSPMERIADLVPVLAQVEAGTRVHCGPFVDGGRARTFASRARMGKYPRLEKVEATLVRRGQEYWVSVSSLVDGAAREPSAPRAKVHAPKRPQPADRWVNRLPPDVLPGQQALLAEDQTHALCDIVRAALTKVAPGRTVFFGRFDVADRELAQGVADSINRDGRAPGAVPLLAGLVPAGGRLELRVRQLSPYELTQAPARHRAGVVQPAAMLWELGYRSSGSTRR